MHPPDLRVEKGSAPPTEHNLCLANTLTKRLEPFKPREGTIVRLVTCGPSVYKKQHVGNYRTFLYEDILHRYLLYRGFERHLNNDLDIPSAVDEIIRILERRNRGDKDGSTPQIRRAIDMVDTVLMLGL
ncbi:MAG: hypothetical protein GF344_14125 [Chitinivibrionales bacterium]|nr:hypothetical protein [Chitinivibrionales bacterium]MBD3357863.1 hypothetical protein [Chitinivibrionales bacterium]